MERTKQDLPHGREEHLHNEDTDESPPEKVSSVLKELGRAFVLFSPILILTFMVFSMLFILMPMSTQVRKF